MPNIVKATFEWVAAHEKCDTAGWRLINQPNMDPSDGKNVAHDMLEHFPDTGVHEINSPQELLALGALIYIRLEDYRIHRLAKDDYDYDNDVIMKESINRGIATQVHFYSLVRQWKRIRLPMPDNVEIEPLIAKAKNQFMQLSKNLRSYKQSYVLYGNSICAEKPQIISWKLFSAWISEGYRKAKERYAGINPLQVTKTFQNVQKAVDQKTVECNLLHKTTSMNLDYYIEKMGCKPPEYTRHPDVIDISANVETAEVTIVHYPDGIQKE